VKGDWGYFDCQISGEIGDVEKTSERFKEVEK